MSDVFISHAAKERERLRPLRDALEAEGWSVFWDEKVPAGRNWRDHIFENLKAARCVIVAWTATSAASDWVREEAEYAKKRRVDKRCGQGHFRCVRAGGRVRLPAKMRMDDLIGRRARETVQFSSDWVLPSAWRRRDAAKADAVSEMWR